MKITFTCAVCHRQNTTDRCNECRRTEKQALAFYALMILKRLKVNENILRDDIRSGLKIAIDILTDEASKEEEK